MNFRWTKIWRVALYLALGVGAASTVGAPWMRYPWFFDLLTNFRLYWILFLSLLAIAFWCSKQRLGSVLALSLVVFCAGSLLRYSFGKSAASQGGKSLRVVSYNIRASSRDAGEILNYLAQQDADIILLMEVKKSWYRKLKSLKSAYPHRVRGIRPGAQGMWLLSRHPISDLDTSGVAPEQFYPFMSVVITPPTGPFRFLGIHPPPPIASGTAKTRNEQLKMVSEVAAASEVPVVLAGDFNCTPFSGHFLDLLDSGRLKDSARGYGFRNTWHRTGSVLPIDHVLISHEVAVSNRKLGPRMGSDHHPVAVDLHLP